ncbi:TMEM143 family protein [Roseofilum sp. BLCC_M154]|uniref:TMEM143 family protein n=1 Tax=Roseofilum acuticapitatum BLCC-M154 TaxID=3022444 RepID=A0ABT7AR10_9CYAN|nr:TMEM143 family protein [Roseofilum acuticapitatum]MDJ1168997.1 TMEM143 family protein [Roseofilum acuticapitatum BLCC-M154]
MAHYSDREAHIPFDRHHLIELCLRDGKLSKGDRDKFRQFCQLLSAYYHFHFHSILEDLKHYYTPFNPYETLSEFQGFTSREQQQMEADFFNHFEQVLERANYFPLSQETLEQAFNQQSLIELNTDVDFNDFDRILFYCQGDIYELITRRKWFRSIEEKLDIFERVVIAMKFKDNSYFAGHKALNFSPGKIYLFYYQNVPKFDLEFLFPNVKVSMTWKDRLILIASAIGAAVPLVIKVLPQIVIIVGIILFFTGTLPGMEELKANEEEVRNLTPVLLTTLSLLLTLGGFAFKQYSSYKTKRLKFQKKVTDTLFFKNLANNTTVFHTLIDAAEEEECKEIILVYYHLLTSGKPMTPEDLDDRIESWMETTWNRRIDFDINGPLNNLYHIRGRLNTMQGKPQSDVPLLSYDEWGKCQVKSLDDSLEIVDYLWDNAFRYSQS